MRRIIPDPAARRSFARHCCPRALFAPRGFRGIVGPLRFRRRRLGMAWKHRDPWTRAPHSLALEPRIMFDAAGAATYFGRDGFRNSGARFGARLPSNREAKSSSSIPAWRITKRWPTRGGQRPRSVIINGDTDALAQMAGASLNAKRNRRDTTSSHTAGWVRSLSVPGGVVRRDEIWRITRRPLRPLVRL